MCTKILRWWLIYDHSIKMCSGVLVITYNSSGEVNDVYSFIITFFINVSNMMNPISGKRLNIVFPSFSSLVFFCFHFRKCSSTLYVCVQSENLWWLKNVFCYSSVTCMYIVHWYIWNALDSLSLSNVLDGLLCICRILHATQNEWLVWSFFASFIYKMYVAFVAPIQSHTPIFHIFSMYATVRNTVCRYGLLYNILFSNLVE